MGYGAGGPWIRPAPWRVCGVQCWWFLDPPHALEGVWGTALEAPGSALGTGGYVGYCWIRSHALEGVWGTALVAAGIKVTHNLNCDPQRGD